MQIDHDQTETKGAYIYRPDPAGAAAKLTYSRAGTSMIIIDHTEVPDAFRGQNVDLALVQHAVAEARRNGWKVVPLCPFAAAQFRRHPDWADVLEGHAPQRR